MSQEYFKNCNIFSVLGISQDKIFTILSINCFSYIKYSIDKSIISLYINFFFLILTVKLHICNLGVK